MGFGPRDLVRIQAQITDLASKATESTWSVPDFSYELGAVGAGG